MSLRAVLSQADYDATPDAMRPNYVAGAMPGTFVLSIDGQHPDLVAANARVAEFRDNNIRLMREGETLGAKVKAVEKDLQDAVAAKALQDALAAKALVPAPAGAVDAPKPAPAGAVDAPKPAPLPDVEALIQRAVEAATRPLAERIAAKELAEADLSAKLAKAEFEKEVAALALASGVRPGAIEDVKDRAHKAGFRWESGKVVARDGDTLRYSAVKPAEELSLGEWLAELPKTADHLFKASGGSGALPNGRPVVVDGGVMVNPSPLEFGRNAEAIAKGKIKVETR